MACAMHGITVGTVNTNCGQLLEVQQHSIRSTSPVFAPVYAMHNHVSNFQMVVHTW
jgi:hypothetical protein